MIALVLWLIRRRWPVLQSRQWAPGLQVSLLPDGRYYASVKRYWGAGNGVQILGKGYGCFLWLAVWRAYRIARKSPPRKAPW